ncbi:alpha/beta fold hydrolase [Fretibacter rubidus]|uniref:alpha/beta fold hydrolase n=1 Tax=Fretibacter rubidus TaxID=570162 RepID=UPI00352BCD7F
MGLLRGLFLIAGLLIVGGLIVTVMALRDTHQRVVALEAVHAFAKTRHGQIEYQRWGIGEPVLVIHGAGGGFDQGRLLVEAMGLEGYNWISVSRFGYLGSAMPENPSTAAQAEAFMDLLDELGIERVSILAMSGGVPPALKFAELFPNNIDHMVLLSPAPFTPFSPDIEDRPIPTWVYSALLENDFIYWCLTKLARSRLEEAFDARRDLRTGLSTSEQVFIHKLIDTFLPASRRAKGVGNEVVAVDPNATYNLEAIRAPVLVIHARDDRLNLFEVSEDIASRVENSQLLPLDTGGHLLLGHHEELSTKIDGFLNNGG